MIEEDREPSFAEKAMLELGERQVRFGKRAHANSSDSYYDLDFILSALVECEQSFSICRRV